MTKARFRRRGERPARRGAEPQYIEIDTSQLAGIFGPPRWLRDLGLLSWFLVGIALAIVGTIWLLTLTQVIVVPVIVAGIIAAVAAPLVRWLASHRVPRAAAAVLVLLLILGLVIGTVLLAIGGIAGQSGSIESSLADAADTVSGWVQDTGVDTGQAESAKGDASKSISTAFHALLNGLGTGVSALASLVFVLAMAVLSLFFLLKDGPSIREWGERHLGVPLPVAQTISSRVIGALRGYFLGVTIVAAYNALIIGVGAVIIGVPVAGTIAIVTFLAGYVPYLGAWGAGMFAVLLALSGGGPDAAIAMAVVALLANGIFQQLVQPFAYGAALGIHPLAVLIVTIAGGAVFGTIGLILAAPLTSAITRISADLARARAEEREQQVADACAEEEHGALDRLTDPGPEPEVAG